MDELRDADVLISTGRLSQEMLDAATSVKWIQCFSAGVDRLPLSSIAERGIVLTNVSGIHAAIMSEHAISLMLDYVRNVPLFLDRQRACKWDSSISTGELWGKTLGIIGTGQIGQELARKAQAFDMRVLGHNRNGGKPAHFDEIYPGEDGLNRLLAESDFVVALIPGTPETEHYLRLSHFRRMKPGSYFINLARGSVVAEEDMIVALQEGSLAGAALDVFAVEPLPESSPLWTMDQVTITPHISGNTPRYVELAGSILFSNLRRYLDGRTLDKVVDPSVGY
ncbi:D-2-hydroxyacid dehydrogenase [Gorillibacterium massiliense]|uniref:D-2-hydroxyacid dehydrogenase n=1 Tax=Gorillibacterium massiliense TaxID=1280390 RepID=UPI001EE1E018|nr:D-2-hydroxyacid dehydrogenase [Gorillibacterium massiliense]